MLVVLERAGMLAVQARTGLRFWPQDEIALVMDECEGRFTVVASDGAVAHCAGPLALPGLVEVAPGVLGSARWGRVGGGLLKFPGGWSFARGPLPKSSRRVSSEPVTCRIARQSIDVRRLRALDVEGRKTRVTLEDGATFVIGRPAATDLAQRLGLEAADSLVAWTDRQQAMFRLGLRDFPCVLLEASASFLRGVLGNDIRLCIANLIWEAVRYRRRGAALDYGTEYRGFWYRPILPVLSRLGLRPRFLAVLAQIRDPQYAIYGDILDDIVGYSRLATFADIGFRSSRPDLRALGTRNPQWLLVVEKASLEEDGRRLAEEFGVSMIILGGMARWEAAEALAAMLGAGVPIKIVAYGDFDPSGWLIDDVLVRMLARYGVTAEIVGRLVLPRRFTEQEIAMLAEPIPMSGPSRPVGAAWMARSGGVNGRALGIHADHLRPYERVRQAFMEETGLR